MTDLKAILNKIDWSYGRTAKRTGYSPKHIQGVANGKYPLTEALKNKLKAALETAKREIDDVLEMLIQGKK